jgi:hypothetical protein
MERAQVLEIEQEKLVVVGNLEGEGQHAGLGLVHTQHARQQERSHFRDCRPHRMALLAKGVPQNDGARLEWHPAQPELLDPFLDLAFRFPFLRKAGEVALHIGHEDRHTHPRQTFGDALEGHRFAGARGACDKAVAVGVAREKKKLGVALGDEQRFRHGAPVVRFTPF